MRSVRVTKEWRIAGLSKALFGRIGVVLRLEIFKPPFLCELQRF